MQLETRTLFSMSPSTKGHTSDCSVHLIFLPNPVRVDDWEEASCLDQGEERGEPEMERKNKLEDNKLAKQHSKEFPLLSVTWRQKQSSVLCWAKTNTSVEEEQWNYLIGGGICPLLWIIYHNGSTWCSERGLAERELEHHKRSISANKAGENSNISLSIFHRSPSHLSLP